LKTFGGLQVARADRDDLTLELLGVLHFGVEPVLGAMRL
jgi:hypothetical protein